MSNLRDTIERIIQRLTEGPLEGSLADMATEQIMYPTNEVMMLMAHKQLGFAPKCYCGWSAPISLNDTESDRQQWAEHVAYTLVWGR